MGLGPRQIYIMRAFHFIVAGNPRLAFKDSDKRVSEFVRRRLVSAGVGSIVPAVGLSDAYDQVARLLEEIRGGYVFVLDLMNPLIDLDLAREMAAAMERTGRPAATCEGAIPGTQIEIGFNVDQSKAGRRFDVKLLKDKAVHVRWPSQSLHNNQFNLYKYKRLKMFLILQEMVDNLHEQTIGEIISTLERDDVFARMAAFGEDVPLVELRQCPHCSGRISALPLSMSQPFCGYLPSSRPLYFECEGCGLVVASPVLHEFDLPRIYDEWDRQDFVASYNNPYHADATRCDFRSIERVLPSNARTLDLGGGMGRFSKYLKETYPNWDVTHSDFEIKRNPELEQLEIRTRALNFLSEPIGSESYDLVTAWEVVEHAPFERFSIVLENIHRSLAPGGLFVFSTPDFDSPLCKSMDFFGLCPPFHYVVLGRKWLETYFLNASDWELIELRSCSDFLDDALMWYDYGARTSPTMQLRGTSRVLGSIFATDASTALRRSLLQQGIGTEIIVTVRKRQR